MSYLATGQGMKIFITLPTILPMSRLDITLNNQYFREKKTFISSFFLFTMLRTSLLHLSLGIFHAFLTPYSFSTDSHTHLTYPVWPCMNAWMIGGNSSHRTLIEDTIKAWMNLWVSPYQKSFLLYLVSASQHNSDPLSAVNL